VIAAEDPFSEVVSLINPSLKMDGSVKRTASENAIFKDGYLCQLKMSDFKRRFS
jgi:hypothetical protein